MTTHHETQRQLDKLTLLALFTRKDGKDRPLTLDDMQRMTAWPMARVSAAKNALELSDSIYSEEVHRVKIWWVSK